MPSELYDSRFVFDLQLFADEGGEKTEEPTAKKKSDARNKGQVAKSQELNAAFVLFIGFWTLKVLGAYTYREIAAYATYIFGNLNTTVDTETVMRLLALLPVKQRAKYTLPDILVYARMI